jgi:hypothetical protein
MQDNKAVRGGALALAVLCWALCTGLAIEKVMSDGIQSWTLLLAMPVLTAAVGILLHLGFQDLREFRFLRGPVALVLAVACLCVTLPASIGSSGQARDTALAAAKQSSEEIAKAKDDLKKAEKLVAEAQNWVAEECKTGNGHRCQGVVVTLYQRQASADKMRRELKGESPKIANSGEHRIAWALGMAGLKVSEADVSMIWPMLPPIAFELLCAFFLYAGLERRVRPGSLVAENQPVMAIDAPKQVELPRVEVFPIAGNNPPSDPRPRKRTTKRQAKREKGVAWVRKYRERHGKAPPLGVVSNVLRVPQTTAFRWRKLAA